MPDENTEKGLAVVDSEAAEKTTETEATVVEVKHKDVRDKVLELRNMAESSYWDLSVVLSDVYKNDLYRSWGYESWRSYVEEELDFTIRTAQHFIAIQNWLDNMTPAMQGWFREMGWTKCRVLLKFVTKENAKQWKNQLKGKTVREIEDIYAQNKATDEGSSSGSEGSSTRTETKSTIRRAFSLFKEQDKIIQTALERAKDVGETDKDGRALELICTDYVATTTNLIDQVSLMKHMEDITGLKIVAFSPGPDGEDTIIYGQQYIDEADDKEEGEPETGETPEVESTESAEE